MSEKLVKGILGTFGGLTSIAFGKELLVFIISLLPILELRGGLLAAALLGLDPIPSYIISIVGNLLPIPFILLLINKLLLNLKITRANLLINKILDKMRNGKKSKKIADWLDKKVEKRKGQIEKFGYFGLVLFVGIPLPGTGAWTGSLIASGLEMDKKNSFLAILVGVIMASIIMMIISFGLVANVVR